MPRCVCATAPTSTRKTCVAFCCIVICLPRLSVAAQARGNTALHFAVAYGFAALADWLRRSGAQPALRNVAGRPAIEGIGPEGDF